MIIGEVDSQLACAPSAEKSIDVLLLYYVNPVGSKVLTSFADWSGQDKHNK